jgi:hypothetical protein
VAAQVEVGADQLKGAVECQHGGTASLVEGSDSRTVLCHRAPWRHLVAAGCDASCVGCSASREAGDRSGFQIRTLPRAEGLAFWCVLMLKVGSLITFMSRINGLQKKCTRRSFSN